MRMMTTNGFALTGAGLVALGGLAWSASPGDAFWSLAIAACVVGSGVATALLLRSRSNPSLAQVISSAEVDLAGGARRTSTRGRSSASPAGGLKP